MTTSQQHRRNPGIADVTFLAYDRREGVEEQDAPSGCGLSGKTMTAIAATCVTIGLIAYLLTSSGESVAVTEKPPSDDGVQERLPRSLLPIDYVLRMIPHLEEGNFTSSGELTIKFKCVEETKEIWLNARDLTFNRVEIDAGAEDILAEKIVYKNKSEIVVIELSTVLKRGITYRVHITFTGVLNDLLQGFYRSSYVDSETGEKRWIASTQFSPTYARRAFPCFDEPSFKARFRISLGRRKNMTSISNMPRKLVENIPGMPGFEWDHYQQTLDMSTYLIAFIVADFASIEVHEFSSPTFKLWSRKDVIDQTVYMSNIGPRMLAYLEGYFNISFPLEKQDMVALPEFGYSAMENWGLITFRESAMLVKEDEAVANIRQMIALIAGHELAHQWFGNLVTPAWWSDLWLKEGFATFFGNMAVNDVEPTWRVTDNLIEDLHKVLEDDALKSSHPISIGLNHTNMITQIFDTISYTKGCSIIRMMSHFLGTDVFRRGIQRYLRTYEYNNAEQDDLWRALTTEAHINQSLPKEITVKMVMDTWTLQTGYPVLHVRRNYRTGVVTVSQDKFCWSSGCEASIESWWIPLTWTTQNHPTFDETKPKVWLSERILELNDTVGNNDWILFNLGETGYYRVNYDDKNWKLLGNSVSTLPAVIRSQLVDDSLAASRAGLLDYQITLGLMERLENETDYLVWNTAVRGFRYIQTKLYDYEPFNAFMRRLVRKVYENVNTFERENDGHRERRCRGEILKWTCDIGHEECLDRAYEYLRDWITMPPGKNPIPANLRSWVYCTGLTRAGQKEWNFLWNQYLITNSSAEKELLLEALACVPDDSILTSYLEKSISSESGVRKQDGWRVFRAVADSPRGLKISFRFLRDKWAAFNEYYGTGFSAVSKIVMALPKYMHTEDDLRELKEFRNSVTLGVTSTAFEQAIEEVGINVDWTVKYKERIQTILSNI